jgi:hypothetical protein
VRRQYGNELRAEAEVVMLCVAKYPDFMSFRVGLYAWIPLRHAKEMVWIHNFGLLNEFCVFVYVEASV